MTKTWYDLTVEKYGPKKAKSMRAFRDLVWLTAHYKPTWMQAQVINAPRLTKLLSGGVRAGKSITSAMMMAEFAIFENEEIWLVGNTFEEAREEFDYLYIPLATLGLVPDNKVSKPDIGRWKMEVTGGAIIRTKSSGDTSKLASVAPIAQLYTEAAQQNSDIFDKALERALEKDSLIVYSGTLEASKQLEFTNLLTKWKEPKDILPTTPQSWSMPTWTNTHIFPLGKEDPKFLRMTEGMTPEKFDERIAAIPYRPAGLVHKRFKTERQIVPLVHDPTLPTEIAIDPGYTTYVVLFLQRYGEYVHILDEIYRHEALTHDIVSETMSHPLWNFVSWGIIDKAARQHHANESVWEVWRRLTGVPLLTRSVSVQDGIDAIETRCMDGQDGQPRLLINNEMSFDVGRNGRSNSLLGEFNLRRWPKYKATRSDGVQPIKANDHALNALGYYLFHWYKQEPEEKHQVDMRGKAPPLPNRLAAYVPTQSKYSGNKQRAGILNLRKKRMRAR